jgi:hypothetical protein
LLADLRNELETTIRSPEDLNLWRNYIESIETLQEYHKFFGILREFHRKDLTIQFPSFTSKITGEELTFYRLDKTDWIRPVLKLRHLMTPGQKFALLTKFQKILSELRTTNKPSRHSWGQLETSLRLALFPQTFAAYIEGVPANTRFIFDQSTYFNQGAQSALKALPTEMILPARQKVSAELVKSYTNESGDHKERRRNLEAVYHLLHKENFSQFLRQIKMSRTHRPEPLTQIIDTLWRQSLGGIRQTGRGEYSFRQVLDSATLIQKELQQVLGESYIDLYGSFPNGKAHGLSSDIDIHPGPELMKTYIQVFTEKGLNYANLNSAPRGSKPIPAFAEVLSATLTNTEKKLAQLLGRSSYRPSELMTIVPALPDGLADRFFVPSVIQFYNPLKLRVYKNHLELHIYDAIEKSRSIIIQISQDP